MRVFVYVAFHRPYFVFVLFRSLILQFVSFCVLPNSGTKEFTLSRSLLAYMCVCAYLFIPRVLLHESADNNKKNAGDRKRETLKRKIEKKLI